MAGTILAIDPGKFHTGIAVLLQDGSVLERKVAATVSAGDSITELYFKYKASAIILGNGGPGKFFEKKLASQDLTSTIIFVNEKGSTLEARGLYWKENKPKGLMRFLPVSLRTPPVPYDDYAAVVIGKRYLSGSLR